MGTGWKKTCTRVLGLLLAISLLWAPPGGLPEALAAESGTPAEEDVLEEPAEITPDEEPAAQQDALQTKSGTHSVNLSIMLADHCRVYYHEKISGAPWSGELKEAETEITRTGLAWPYGIILFAAPEEGYAMSAMTADGSNGNYYTISDGQPDGTGCEFLSKRTNYQNLIDKAGYTEKQVREVVAAAVAKGCDGVMLFSRSTADANDVSSALRFYVEQLPTLEKRIVSITDAGTDEERPYAGNMSVGLGDRINYALDVTFYALRYSKFSIEYTDVFVTDENTGNGEAHPIEITAPSAEELKHLTEDQVVTEHVAYTITQQDVELGTVVNQAQLHYQYRSLHSSGQLATISDAQAKISVHASVNYRYISGTAGKELPEELAGRTPVDYEYHDQDTEVPVKGHTAASPFWDAGQNGYWTLQDGGMWRDAEGRTYEPGGVLKMPNVPVVLTAVWVFTGAPAVSAEKTGSLSIHDPPDDMAEGDAVSYTADYVLTIRNTGGEDLKEFAVSDATFPEDAAGIACEIGGAAVTLQTAFAPDSHTLLFALESGLRPGQTLTLSWTCRRDGALGYKLLLSDKSAADVAARGAQTGVEAQGGDELTLTVTLEERIMLVPADIVIYAGGAETDSEVVGGDGVAADRTNLPEPGFFVILPLAAEQELRRAIGNDAQADLSRYLTFQDSAGNVWGLELFSEGYSKANGSYLYRLIPVDPPGQEPIQMQFYDGERYIIQSDFDITRALHREYEMKIYPGEIPAKDPRAVLTVGDEEIGTYTLGVTPGRLIVRGTTDGLTTAAVRADEPEQVTGITACTTAADTQYYINESRLTVEADHVALLVDDIVDDAHSQTLKTLAGEVLQTMDGRLHYQFQYLDLVDTSMGNAWVTASVPLEIVWPYPEGTDREDPFTIIHYVGLDRDYELSAMETLRLGTDYTLEVYTTGAPGADTAAVTYHELTAGEKGLVFAADGFSPYVLIWNEPAGTSVRPSAGNGPAGLNTQDHLAYLMGRGDGGIQPLEPITRGQLAAILFRLLTDETREAHWSSGLYYADVGAETWCRVPVATLTDMGILQGYGDGLFRPEKPITRAEFTAVIVRFFQPREPEGEILFSDVDDGDWFAGAVCSAAALGLVQGRKDGTFDPYAPLTRAEAAVILNRALGRKADETPPEDLADRWYDNSPQAWYYGDMLEASVSHSFTAVDDGERWTALLTDRDWAALERRGSDGI